MLVHDLSLFGRVACAAGLGYVVGWEREVRGHAAGARTLSTVSAGAAAFTVIAVDAFAPTAEKLIAGIVTGIGFLGAGIVLRGRHTSVKGLTTAATIWVVAAVGVAAGAGRFVLAALTTALQLVVLELRAIPVLRHLDPGRSSHRFTDDAERAEPP